jgi:hypothetical protein
MKMIAPKKQMADTVLLLKRERKICLCQGLARAGKIKKREK